MIRRLVCGLRGHRLRFEPIYPPITVATTAGPWTVTARQRCSCGKVDFTEGSPADERGRR